VKPRPSQVLDGELRVGGAVIDDEQAQGFGPLLCEGLGGREPWGCRPS
jgi:hypothetical protein